MKTKTTTFCGESFRVQWEGDVWVAPTRNTRHTRASDAMRLELRNLVVASGDDPDDPAIAAKIESAIDRMESR